MQSAHLGSESNAANSAVWVIRGHHSARPPVLLVSPPDDQDRFRLGLRRGRGWSANLGLLHLATHLGQNGWTFETACEVPDENAMASISNGAIVGISTVPSNYFTALRIASLARDSGAVAVVLGGPYAGSRPLQILKNQRFVDFVVTGPGEHALASLAAGVPCEMIPGLSYRTNDGYPLSVPPQILRLQDRPVPDHRLWPKQDAQRVSSDYAVAYLHDGCPVALRDPCVFCTILHPVDLSRRSVDQMIAELAQLATLGYTSLEDGGDDFAAGGRGTTQWLDDLADAMEAEGLVFKWFVHSSVRSLVRSGSRMFAALSRVGVEIIQVGFETGDPSLCIPLKTSPGEEQQLVDLAKAYGQKLAGSWILGLPGEDSRTMHNTAREALALYSRGMLAGIEIDPLWPGPGSRAFDMVCKHCPQWADSDFILPQDLMAVWYREYTGTSLDDVLLLRERVLSEIQTPLVGGMLL